MKEAGKGAKLEAVRHEERFPAWISEIHAIGWDLDGTLYPPSAFPLKVFREHQYAAVAHKNGWDLTRARDEYEQLYIKLGSNTKTMDALGIDGASFFTSLWDTIDLPKYIKKDNKVSKLFSELTVKRHFLLSNSNRLDQIQRKLGLLGLPIGVFEFVLSTLDLEAVKPDPKPFLVALEKLQLQPEEVLYIGDRVGTDIMGAHGVGMRTCLVWRKASEADISLPTVYDVGELFKSQISKRKTQNYNEKLKT